MSTTSCAHLSNLKEEDQINICSMTNLGPNMVSKLLKIELIIDNFHELNFDFMNTMTEDLIRICLK